jgi:hypothetical protein
MKTKNISIMVLAFLAFALSACSFTTANLSSLDFGKNQKAEPTATTFNVGETVFSVAKVSGAMGKYKVKFKVTTPDKKSQDKDVDFDGSQGGVFLSFTPAMPGEFQIEATLVDDAGKEIGKKSGTFTVKGEIPAPAESKKNEADHDSEDKKSDEKSDDN